MTDLTDHPNLSSSGPWPKKLWRRFVSHLREKVARGAVYLAAGFVLGGFLLVLQQNDDLNRRASERAIYQTQVDQYTQDVADYRLCIDGVARSDLNRGQWEDLVEIIRQFPNADELADSIAAGPLLSSQPRQVSECPDPGPAPVAPDD